MKHKFILSFAMVAALVFGIQAEGFAFGKKVKKTANFKVRIENISNSDGLMANDGSKYPFAISPGVFVLTQKGNDFFSVGKKASDGVEAQAEDGNPEVLSKKLLTKIGSVNMGIFNTPFGGNMPAPAFPGGAFEFTFRATEGTKLNFLTMFGQSNDLFYAPSEAFDLFPNGEALNGDITDKFELWDAGTEVNQAPGLGADQAPRQKGPNTGAAENGVVQLVKDGFVYPNTKDVLRITISVQ